MELFFLEHWKQYNYVYDSFIAIIFILIVMKDIVCCYDHNFIFTVVIFSFFCRVGNNQTSGVLSADILSHMLNMIN